MRRRRTAIAFLLLAVALGPSASGVEPASSGALAEALRRGAERLRVGDAAAAAEALQQAVALAPDSAEAQALLGRALALERRYLGAEQALRRAVELGRRDLATRFYLGSTLWENGRLAEAEQVFRAALDGGSRPALVLHQLGRLLLWQGRGAEAVPFLREAVEKEPAAADVALDLARALEAAGDAAGALEAYRRGVALAPEDAQARYGLAAVLGQLGQHEAARRELAVYQRLYREDQERTREEGLEEARIARGHELMRAGRPGDAVALLEHLPESAGVLAALAAAHQAGGDPAAALRALERAVALAPERQDLRARLAEMRLLARPEP